MSSLPFYLIFILGVFTMTEQRNKPVMEIEELLDYLAEKSSKNGDEDDDTYPYYSGQQVQKRRVQDDNNPNSMNIQTLNLYHKHNNLRNKEQASTDLEKALRFENDRICKVTGRCGCSSGRCGRPSGVEDRSVDDMDKLLKDIERELNENHKHDEEHRLEYDDLNNKNFELKRTEDKYKREDDLDIAFLEVPDSEDEAIMNKLQDLGDDINIIDLRDIDLRDILHNRKSTNKNFEKLDATFKAVNPEDLFIYYELGKMDISNALLEYIKGRREEPYLDNLTSFQRKQIDRLKEKYSQTPMAENEIKAQIVNLLFGSLSSTRVLPQLKDGNVYIPRRVYDAVLKFTKSKQLRSQRSLFPLTSQQKERQHNKDKIQNKIGSNTYANKKWRRNMQQRSTYGMPFDLEVHGLGQLNY